MKICQFKQNTLEKKKSDFSHSTLFQVKIRVSLQYFVTDCSSTHEKLNADINIVICTTSVQKRKLAWSKNDKKNPKMFSKKHMQK